MQAVPTTSDRHSRILLCGPPAVRSYQLDHQAGWRLIGKLCMRFRIECYLQLRAQLLTTDVQHAGARRAGRCLLPCFPALPLIPQSAVRGGGDVHRRKSVFALAAGFTVKSAARWGCGKLSIEIVVIFGTQIKQIYDYSFLRSPLLFIGFQH